MSALAILDARLSPVTVLQMGENTAEATRQAGIASAAAVTAETARDVATSSGPFYTSVALGQAATTNGQEFAVAPGDGTVSWYRRTVSSSTLLFSIATPPMLAAIGASALIGANDHASSTKWTTVQGFLDYVLGTNGSDSVGYLPEGLGGVATTVQSKLRRAALHGKDYGILGGGANETTALQIAVNAAIALKQPLYLPDNVTAGAITITGPCEIIGTGGMTTLTAVPGSYTGMTVSSDDVTLRNFIFEDASKTAGADFLYACSSATRRRLVLDNILVRDSFGMFTDSGTGTAGRHIDTHLSNFRSERLRGDGINMQRGFAYIFLEKVSADFTTVSTNQTGFKIDASAFASIGDAGGVSISQCNVLGSATAFTTAVVSQRGFSITNISGVDIAESKADGVGEYGWLFYNTKTLRASNIASLHAALGQFYFDQVLGAQISGYSAIGRKLAGLAYQPTARDGVYFNGGCDDINMSGGLVRDNTGHGIDKAAAQVGPILVSSTTTKFNGGRNLYSRGASPFHFISGQLQSGGAGDYDLGGVNDYIIASIGNSGSPLNVGPGPVVG